MLLNILFLVAGIVLLMKGADFFIDAGSAIAKIFKVSDIFLGLTLVSFGTSLPELVIGINASLTQNYGISIGNIVGTNIFNMCAILGTLCIINPVKFLRETVKKDIYMSLISSVILFIVLFDTFSTTLTQNVISRTDGVILLIFFAIFMYYTLYAYNEYKTERKKNTEEKNPEEKTYHITLKDIDKICSSIFLIILGLVMIFVGADFVVESASNIARALNFSQAFIAILVIAIGTSLPEISTSIVAMKKGKGNIAIGNLIGSNMFNTLFILGTASVISPIILPSSNLLIDCGVYIFACLLIAIFSRCKFEISKKEGVCLLLVYLGYLIYVINRL